MRSIRKTHSFASPRGTAIALLTLVALIPLATTSEARLLPRHVPEKPVTSELWPGLRSDLIIVKFVEGSEVRLRDHRLVSYTDHDLTAANQVLTESVDLRVARLFTRAEESLERDRLRAQERSGKEMADLNNYYTVSLSHPGAEAAEALLDELNALPVVEIAYAEPIPELALFESPASRPVNAEAPTPDFQGMQDYMEAAPLGIDAYAGWSYPGGRGETVKIIDIELGWNWNHEDMKTPFFQGGAVSYGDHGVAVVGEFASVDNGYGVTGIANAVEVGCYSVYHIPTAQAFDEAVSQLDPGDIFVIELHCPGPDGPYIALEWWQANFDVIAMATANGIICCEAAGNGSADFDHPRYQGRFDRNVRDSGAIIVGATDGGSMDPAYFTNYGSRVDLSGWGFDVVTTGYGDLQGGGQNQWYTASFSGTSSATPIVTGAVAVMQGIYRAHSGGVPLSGNTIAQVLKETGTPQNGWQHIGPRPNLALAVPAMLDDLASITGTVTETGSGAAIEAATVQIRETGTRTRTAADGTYTLPITPGTWTCVTEKFGYRTNVSTIVTTAGGATVHDVSLGQLPTSSVTGIVVNEIGGPIAGATVTIPDTPLSPTTSQTDGSYEITGVPALFSGYVVATAEGWTPDVRPVSVIGLPAVVDLRLAVPHDFEADNGGFSGTAGWQWGVPNFGEGPDGAHSGERCWGTNLTGYYSYSQTHRLTTPDFDLSDMQDPRLSFWHWYAIWGPYDGANVNISTNGGASWQVLEPVEGYPDPCIDALGYPCPPGWAGWTGDWVPACFDLNAYAGQTVRFRFTLAPWGYTDSPGWYIDDFKVHGAGEAIAVESVAGAHDYLGRPTPAPSNGQLSVPYGLKHPAHVTARVFDASGRRVRLLQDGLLGKGTHLIRWDGMSDSGLPVAPGIYFLRVTDGRRLAGSGELTRKLVVVK